MSPAGGSGSPHTAGKEVAQLSPSAWGDKTLRSLCLPRTLTPRVAAQGMVTATDVIGSHGTKWGDQMLSAVVSLQPHCNISLAITVEKNQSEYTIKFIFNKGCLQADACAL